MPVVFRAHGLSFVIFVDDHEPAHVHVFGNGEAKIEIGRDGSPPRMVYVEGMKASVQRRAWRTVEQNATLLLTKWIELHGRAH